MPEEGSAHGKTVAVTPCPLKGVHTEPAYRAPERECTRSERRLLQHRENAYRAQEWDCTRYDGELPEAKLAPCPEEGVHTVSQRSAVRPCPSKGLHTVRRIGELPCPNKGLHTVSADTVKPGVPFLQPQLVNIDHPTVGVQFVDPGEIWEEDY